MLIKLLVIPSLIALLLASSCQMVTGSAPVRAERQYLPMKEMSPPTGKEAPDDIVPTPGGGAYRANVHQQGVENPWPPITSTETVLGAGPDALTVSYRDRIETDAGQIHNNIVNVRREGGLFDSRLALYSVGVPAGINLFSGGGVGLPGTLGRVVVIETEPDVVPGAYSFEIGIEVDGHDYGTVPCTLVVIESAG